MGAAEPCLNDQLALSSSSTSPSAYSSHGRGATCIYGCSRPYCLSFLPSSCGGWHCWESTSTSTSRLVNRPGRPGLLTSHPAMPLRGELGNQAGRAAFLGDQPFPLGDRDDPQPPDRVAPHREAGQVGHVRAEQLGRVVEQEHGLLAAAERERTWLVIPADRM